MSQKMIQEIQAEKETHTKRSEEVSQQLASFKERCEACQLELVNIANEIKKLDRAKAALEGTDTPEAPKRRGRPSGSKARKATKRKPGQRLSAAGREAISKAAKKRWRKYRRENT